MMATRPKGMDRRVIRTREIILQAARKAMREKRFAEITVQDIADEANVNRGTFYAHFADKYEVAEVIIRKEFTQHLESKLPADAKWENATLQLLITTVLEFFDSCNISDPIVSLVDRASHEELENVFIKLLLKSGDRGRIPSGLALETFAHIVTCFIFGVANQRKCSKSSGSPQQIANDVSLILMEGFFGGSAGTLSESKIM
jgi:AcrR family transcriptional regulator